MNAQLQETLNKAAWRAVEITVRKANEFTFSYIGKSEKAERAIANIFAGRANRVEVDFDDELDETFIYVTLAA